MKRLLSSLAIFCCAALAHADGYESGVDAYRAGDYAKALRIFEGMSARGYGEGDWMLSVMYANGAGVPQDIRKSEELAIRAAERGAESAYVLVAITYFSKKSERYDPSKGLEWLQKGVKSHSDESMRHLAKQKVSGVHTPQDKEGAFRLMKECMDLGNQLCTVGLAEMYAKGVGTTQSYVKAFRLYQTIRDDAGEISYQLGRMTEEGQGTNKDYARAMEYYMNAAVKQNGAAMNRIGELHLRGLGVPRDYAQAAFWFEKAADLENSDGLVNGGRLYAQGLGVKRDDVEAEKWYLEAADKGSANAMRALARFQEEGRGTSAGKGDAGQMFCQAALIDQERLLEDLDDAKLEPTARKSIVGELAVIYHCKDSEEARKFTRVLEPRLTRAEREDAQALAGSFTKGGIAKALDSYVGLRQ